MCNPQDDDNDDIMMQWSWDSRHTADEAKCRISVSFTASGPQSLTLTDEHCTKRVSARCVYHTEVSPYVAVAIVCPTINMSSVEPVCSGPVVQLSAMFDGVLNVQPEVLYVKREVTQQPSAPSAVLFLSSSISLHSALYVCTSWMT